MAGIGIQAIIDAGFVDAVDVWGTVTDAKVCFANVSGSMLFLDAAKSPRMAAPIESVTEAGKVCATIDRQGTLALVGASAAGPAARDEPITVASGNQIRCMVTTTTFISFRDSPGGPNVLFYVRPNVTMYARGRSGDWFSVRLLDTDGWISANYVVSEGICS